jgi:hypothetical protein
MLLGLSLVAVSGLILVAADHIDAPLQCQETQVILMDACFSWQNTSNLVFAVNTKRLLSPILLVLPYQRLM